MADPNIKLMGAIWPTVPAVDLLTDTDDTARYYYAEDGDEMEYGISDATSSMVGVGKVGSMIIK